MGAMPARAKRRGRAHAPAVLLCAAISAAATGDIGAQTISVTPELIVFSATTTRPNPPPQSTSIASVASGALNWTASAPRAAWLRVTPTGGTTPGALQATASAAGLRPGTYTDTIRVKETNDTTRLPVVIVLRVAPPPPAGPGVWASYEIEAEHVGSTGLMSGPGCKVDPQGYDRLTGIVTGFEPNAPDEEVVYTGTVARTTRIDYCETKKAPTIDQRAPCVISLVGFGVTEVRLEVTSEDGRGAQMKADAVPGPRKSSVRASDCDAQETSQARNDYHVASDLGAASPNGQPIDDDNAVDPAGRPITFAVNGVARLRVGTYPPNQADGWTLRVKRKLP